MIRFACFGNAVYGHGFLKNAVTAVFFIPQDVHNHVLAEAEVLSGNLNVLGLECLRDKSHWLSSEKHFKNPFYDGRFLRHDLRFAILAFPVAQQPLVLKAHFPILEVFAVGPCDVLADALGFGLRKACVNDKIQFTVAFQRVNVLFLKENPNALRFQRAYIFQTLYRVSGEAGDGFCDDIVDLSVLAVADHALKFRAFVRPCAGDALIGIKAGKLPLFPGGDHFCINAHLVLIGCKLFFGVCGDAAVGRHSLLVIFLLVYKDGLLRFNQGDCPLWDFLYFHSVYPRFHKSRSVSLYAE